jgi:3-hydroxyacyl-CoA dehydrogenase
MDEPPPTSKGAQVGVIGLGLMGHGIVQVAAEAGFRVVGVDANSQATTAGMKRIEGSLAKVAARRVKKGIAEDEANEAAKAALGRISTSTDIAAVGGCDLVIEAIVEDVKAKHKLWDTVANAAAANSSAIFASNTSSLQLADMIASTRRPDRFVGLHFFNPVQMMGLVEVVRAAETSDSTFDIAMRFGRAVGKVPVACKDTPGFVVNRLLVPYMAQVSDQPFGVLLGAEQRPRRPLPCVDGEMPPSPTLTQP